MTADPFRVWDAAYLLGALSPSERRAYEDHLAGCLDCSTEIGSLAGLSGILSLVPAERAMELVQPDLAAEVAPPDVLPKLAAAAERRCRSTRWRLGALAALAACAAAILAAVAWVAPQGSGPAGPELGGRSVALSKITLDPPPLSATAALSAEPWGTRIEATCTYHAVAPQPWVEPQEPFQYALFVTDDDGVSTQVASWTALPGTTATPSATTTLALNQIEQIDIRSVSTGAVLLQATL